ncbi:MAG: Uncharacterized protein XD81_0007 [Bacteroidetes bacterium 38_7]|nr:MAG: Uncharacterized protein XD81_0007 [Bacteroidetes bacterium 38_7]HAL64988.1 hypothetical protein [Bacteroidales bacterium]
MKQIFQISIFLLLTTYVFGQQVPREMVILEIGTGTWCQYCPGAAMGADDLLANGCLVAVVENHNGDPFANQYSNARNSFYAITGYPTAIFDGISRVVGGNHSQSMYPTYLPRYNQRIAIPCDYSMDMQITNSGLDYTAVITITKVAPNTATGLKLHFFVTQSHISYNWQGQNHVNFVNRLMVPDQNGTAIDFSGGDVVTVTLNFSLDPTWPVEDIEFVAGIQAQNKEFLQGIKKAAIDLHVDFAASDTIIPINQPVTFTNYTTGGYIGTPETYQWFFPGATPDTSSEANPTVTYTECGSHNVKLIVNHGGQIDSLERQAYVQVGPLVNITASPSDTSFWPFNPIVLDATIDDPQATYLWQPSGETTPSITVTFDQYGLGEHTFTVTVNSSGCEIIKSHTIYFYGVEGINDNKNHNLNIFPNPASSSLHFYVEKSGVYNIYIKDLTGKTIISKPSEYFISGNDYILNIKDLSKGIYLLQLVNESSSYTQKLIVR